MALDLTATHPRELGLGRLDLVDGDGRAPWRRPAKTERSLIAMQKSSAVPCGGGDDTAFAIDLTCDCVSVRRP